MKIVGTVVRTIITRIIKENGNLVFQGIISGRFAYLIESLCDLISGSNDKGIPVVYVQGTLLI